MSRLLPLFLVIAGCSKAPTSSEFDGWLGHEPHFRAEGTLDGETVEVRADEVSCTLEWEAPVGQPDPDYAAGRMTEIRLSGVADDRMFELELKRHDFQRDVLPVDVPVVPRDEIRPPEPGEAWVEWEWKTPDGQDLYEQSAVGGLVTLALLTGETDHTGLILMDGDVGGFVSARWSPTEALSVSFAAPCSEPLLELVEP